jgi:alkanesulfonate monooxygenase SsuD/methylene tetrahydromethanopterin reductase-like flavin-dependent oxidoreductase (luciferase family)
MKLGVIFPQTEIGTDPAAIRDYAQAAEGFGYDHIVAYDHVVGASLANRPGWTPPYTHKDGFHEPFVLYGYLAGLTEKIALVTGIIYPAPASDGAGGQTGGGPRRLEQRASSSRRRHRLEPGRIRSPGMNFKDRGKRSEEQIEVMRLLWTKELVTFKGRWHTITDAGISPLPVQRPIPVWFGGNAEPVLQRVGRLGDGWFPLADAGDKVRAMIEKVKAYAREAGRDPRRSASKGASAWPEASAEKWREAAAQWRALGATHLSVNTMKAGLARPADHIDAIRRFREAVGSA